jgi:hypothetical protein
MGRSTFDGCVFCGRPWTEVSKSWEHILAQWFRKHAGPIPSSRTTRSLGLDFDVDNQKFIELPFVDTTSQSPLLNLRTRNVCKECNSVWMSQVEQAAEPWILALASAAEHNTSLILDRDAARKIALWAMKTSATYELTGTGPHIVNVSMGQRLRSRKPFRGSIVWTARHPNDYMLSIGKGTIEISGTPTVRPGDKSRFVMLTAITYHYLTLLTFITDTPGQVSPPIPIKQWSLIWPPSGRTVEYPPMEPLTGSQLTSTFTDLSKWLPHVQPSALGGVNLL